jgi:voltage-gated potassium channel Kch
VYGVDFSGARLAGHTTWIAHLVPSGVPGGVPPWTLVALDPLARLAGTAEREAALAHLTRRVLASDRALWAFDFPFGLPLEVLPPRSGWRAHGRLVREWAHDGYGLGLECVRRAQALGGPMHVRRQTDADARAPFDPYHYRIIYQTFHGLRDVAGPLADAPGTALLPFQYAKARAARRVLVETCPASTLRRLGLPARLYKQPEGGPLTRPRRRTRRAILDGLAAHVRVGDAHRRRVMRDPGGDALDAVVAAVGAAQAVGGADHAAIARHPRFRREGHLFY